MQSPTLHQIFQSNDKQLILSLLTFDRTDSVERIVFKFNSWVRFFFPKFLYDQDTGEYCEDAPFHNVIDTENAHAYIGEIKTFTDIAYRGAAKTTRTKLFIAFCISSDREHYRKYIKILAEDGTNSKQSVTDIYNLLVDEKLSSYYPGIFAKTDNKKREERMESFTTTTGVKLMADTVGSGQRGQLQDEARPDLIWFDDFETRNILRSGVKMKQIWDNMEEAKNGLSKSGGCIYTCNYLSERGNVHKLVMKKSDTNPVLIVPIEEGGKPTWNRYTQNDIERIKADAEDYEGEYLCKPSASKDVLFDRERMDAMLERAKKQGKPKTVAGLRLFKKFDASHRYGIGSDVGGGVGLDHSTSVGIDFDVLPAQVVCTFADNEVKPDTFGDELKRHGEEFGKPIVGVENNKFDMAIGRLKQIYPLDKIYKTMPPEDKVERNGRKPLPTYGWNTNALTKPKMIYALAKAVNDGLLELNDEDLIMECRSYTRNDLMDAEPDPRLSTRHFDLLMAAAIAWQMKDFSVAPPKQNDVPEEDEKPIYSDIGV